MSGPTENYPARPPLPRPTPVSLDKDLPDERAGGGNAAAPYTLIERWVARSGLTWPGATAAAALAMLLPLALAAWLDGVTALPFDAAYWRVSLLAPAVVLYILATHPQFGRLRREAIEAFRPLVRMDAAHFEQMVAAHLPLDRRREWLAFAGGAAAGLLLLRPWEAPEPAPLVWSHVYRTALSGLMCGLIAAVIYGSLAAARFLNRLHRQPLALNVFDLTAFEPVARRSLSYAVALIGGITLGLAFIPNQDARGLVINGAVVLAAVLIFFISLRDTHRVMRRAKEQELQEARRHLAETHRQLLKLAEAGQTDSLGPLSTHANLWLNYERRIREAPEWPFTGTMLRYLLMSVLIPVILVTLQRVAVEAVTKLLAGTQR